MIDTAVCSLNALMKNTILKITMTTMPANMHNFVSISILLTFSTLCWSSEQSPMPDIVYTQTIVQNENRNAHTFLYIGSRVVRLKISNIYIFAMR